MNFGFDTKMQLVKFGESSFHGLEEGGESLIAVDIKEDHRKRWNGKSCRDSVYGQLFQQNSVEGGAEKWSGS